MRAMALAPSVRSLSLACVLPPFGNCLVECGLDVLHGPVPLERFWARARGAAGECHCPPAQLDALAAVYPYA